MEEPGAVIRKRSQLKSHTQQQLRSMVVWKRQDWKPEHQRSSAIGGGVNRSAQKVLEAVQLFCDVMTVGLSKRTTE